MKKMLVQYIAGAISKVLHDDENKDGLWVKSKKHPAGWLAYGDGKLDAAGQKYVVEAVEVSKNEMAKAINTGLDFKTDKSGVALYEKVKPWVYPVSAVEDYIPKPDAAKVKPLPEWRVDPYGWDTMDTATEQKLSALIKRYLDDKTLEEMIAKIDARVEVEVDWSPNVYARPRDATRKVIKDFRDKPAEFLSFAAATPKDFNKTLEKAFACSMGI